MADQKSSTEIIKSNPINQALLETFWSGFRLLCQLKTTSTVLLSALQNLRAAQLLPSSGRDESLHIDLIRFNLAVSTGDSKLDQITPLLRAVLAKKPDNEIWEHVYHAVTISTPPPRPIASFLQQTPWVSNTGGVTNSSEYRKDTDVVLRNELGVMYVGLSEFHDRHFGSIPGLEAASEAFKKQCAEGSDSLLSDNGWRGWPEEANQDDVLGWFSTLREALEVFTESYQPSPDCRRRRLLGLPNKSVHGSTARRKMDIGIVDSPTVEETSRLHWAQVLVPGELKRNPSSDRALEAGLDLARYAREVFFAQDTRRFILGFTLCGPYMRVWQFDRLGGIASDAFDINKDSMRFISTVLGFLWMSKEQLGFDPTIVRSGDERYIEIDRNGSQERIFIDGTIRRAACIAGRATTCWRAHPEGDPKMHLVIKDSWQYPEREEEGLLLREATDRGAVNVSRYYHHETVQVYGTDDDINGNVRKGIRVAQGNVRKRINAAQAESPGARLAELSSTGGSSSAGGIGRGGGSSSTTASRKRPSSSLTDSPLPPSKRSCSISAITKGNRVHRRIIIRDYGLPIYKASTRAALLKALDGCIQGHKSLHEIGVLHRDISAQNLVINEDGSSQSWPSFLIDLDLAIREQREGVSGAVGKTGTLAFMAIGALLGEQHTFMHDLESFFWVLFWICVHQNGPNEGRIVPRFERWNYANTEDLATLKMGIVIDEEEFLEIVRKNFTAHYQPLVPWINRLRRQVFPNGKRWKVADLELYSSMSQTLREAQEDPAVLGIQIDAN